MANEIDASMKLTLNAASTSTTSLRAAVDIPAGRLRPDQASALLVSGSPSIGFAAHEALPMGDVVTAGWAFFQNLGPTNFVLIGIDIAGAFHQFAKLKAGEAGLIRLGTNAPYAKADTAAVNLLYLILAD